MKINDMEKRFLRDLFKSVDKKAPQLKPFTISLTEKLGL